MLFSDDGNDDDNVNDNDDHLETVEDDDGSFTFNFLVKFCKVEKRVVEKYETPDSKLFWSV